LCNIVPRVGNNYRNPHFTPRYAFAFVVTILALVAAGLIVSRINYGHWPGGLTASFFPYLLVVTVLVSICLVVLLRAVVEPSQYTEIPQAALRKLPRPVKLAQVAV
jgi:phosphatidylserine synthase